MAGLAIAVAVLVCLSSFGNGYRRALGAELDRMGMQMMLVPLGCPYDAAARVLKGKGLENSLPQSALEEARRDPAVAVAAPLLMTVLPRPDAGRADMWVGLDQTSLSLKPWWRAKAGKAWFTEPDSVILGADAAEVEMRSPGDRLFSPETGQMLRVAGVLERSGTSDDNLFFVSLDTAQRMFKQPWRLTAIAIRLRDPALLQAAAQRLQRIPGAQVVTLTEMMGTFLNLVGAVRTLVFSVALLAITISGLGVLNTLLAAVVERTNELSVMRAIGASRLQILALITTEALLLTGAGSIGGIVLALVLGPGIEDLVKQLVPLAPAERLLSPSAGILCQTAGLGVIVGVLGALFPAWRASRLQPAEALRAE
jgi:putative ABC transport system permease protein